MIIYIYIHIYNNSIYIYTYMYVYIYVYVYININTYMKPDDSSINTSDFPANYLEVSWNRGTPSDHPFKWHFPLSIIHYGVPLFMETPKSLVITINHHSTSISSIYFMTMEIPIYHPWSSIINHIFCHPLLATPMAMEPPFKRSRRGRESHGKPPAPWARCREVCCRCSTESPSSDPRRWSKARRNRTCCGPHCGPNINRGYILYVWMINDFDPLLS